MTDLIVGLANAKPPPTSLAVAVLPDPASDKHSRCSWGASTLDYAHYHDTEWGRATTDERTLFEKLCLEGFQSGLSWLTILRKRDAFRRAFANFDAPQVANFGPTDVERMLADASIVRHRGKIEASINNAQVLVQLWAKGESLADLIWSHEPARPHSPRSLAELPAQTEESSALSKMLKKRGFRFVGPTTAYAAMQAMGVVNDHLTQCWVRQDCETSRKAIRRH